MKWIKINKEEDLPTGTDLFDMDNPLIFYGYNINDKNDKRILIGRYENYDFLIKNVAYGEGFGKAKGFEDKGDPNLFFPKQNEDDEYYWIITHWMQPDIPEEK